jgi:late competence protein required for DNA uptake (superfamily II DNA/RNA helicase)
LNYNTKSQYETEQCHIRGILSKGVITQLVLETRTKREDLEAQLQDALKLLKASKKCGYCGNTNLRTIILASNGEIVCQKCGTVLGRLLTSADNDASFEERSEPLCDEERTLEDHVSKYGWHL